MDSKKYFHSALFVIISILFFSCNGTDNKEEIRTLLFDDDWRFIKDDPSGAEKPTFNDSNWRSLDLPHDWSIEDLPNQMPDSIIGPFSKASVGKMRTGYTIGGTAWYRKTFTIDKADENKIAYLQFDGVYMNSDVWVNGQHVGNHPYGYTSFYYDITPFLNPAGQPNVVAVQVKNEGQNSRWYSGSGIYRHTWLTLVNPVHIVMWGVNIETSVAGQEATVNVASTISNTGSEKANIDVRVQIIDADGNEVGSAINSIALGAVDKNQSMQSVIVSDPSLWSIDAPNLYTARVNIMQNNQVLDVLDTKFGIRTIEFSAEKGFLLNGNPLELVGGCFHHDNGPLGAKAIDRAEERKIEIFKKLGYNAIRTSHNPPSPYLLDACDRLGILVIDEIFDNWEEPKVSEEDYSQFFKNWWKKDLESMVIRDRNHPSVIMWSFGNEIHQSLDTASGFRITQNMVNTISELDKTRAITVGYNDFAFRSGDYTRWHNAAPSLELLDVVGYNYMYQRYAEDHEKYPVRIMAATEFGPLFSLENWKAVEDYSFVIGNFAWVVMDYLGEAGVGVSRIVPDVPSTGGRGGMGAFFSRDSWPIYNDFQGDIDLVGNIKPRYYHQQVVWRKSEIEMLVHEPVPAGMKENVSQWGWPNELKCWSWEGQEGEMMQVHVYTRSPLVNLELNDKIIGEQAVDGDTSITTTFEVPYEPGILIARSYDVNGVETGADTLKTLGKSAAVRLVADRMKIRADRNDLSYVMAEIIDQEGNVIPNANSIMINFEISGNGEIAGVGSGSPVDMMSFQQPHRRTWHGRCLAIVRPLGKSAGTISLNASSEGLEADKIEILLQ